MRLTWCLGRKTSKTSRYTGNDFTHRVNQHLLPINVADIDKAEHAHRNPDAGKKGEQQTICQTIRQQGPPRDTYRSSTRPGSERAHASAPLSIALFNPCIVQL